MPATQDASRTVNTDTNRALVTCFIANQNALKGFIRKSVPQESDVEDVFQKLLLKVLGREWHDTIDNPLAYGYRIAQNLIIDFQRDYQKQPESLPDESTGETIALETLLEHQERVQLYQTVVTAMPAKRQAIFIRRRLHGESREQIAQDLGMSEEAVKKHISRALDDLKQAVEKRYAEKNCPL